MQIVTIYNYTCRSRNATVSTSRLNFTFQTVPQEYEQTMSLSGPFNHPEILFSLFVFGIVIFLFCNIHIHIPIHLLPQLPNQKVHRQSTCSCYKLYNSGLASLRHKAAEKSHRRTNDHHKLLFCPTCHPKMFSLSQW